MGGEGAPSPLHLEVHRFAHEGAAVGGDGQELGVVGREVLEEAAAGLLTGPEIEALEARAQAGSEPQVGVGRPYDGRHLLGEQAQMGLTAALLAPDSLGAGAITRIVAGKGDGRLHARTSHWFPLASIHPQPPGDPGLDVAGGRPLSRPVLPRT